MTATALALGRAFAQWALTRMHPMELLVLIRVALRVIADGQIPPGAPDEILKVVEAAKAGSEAIEKALDQRVVIASGPIRPPRLGH